MLIKCDHCGIEFDKRACLIRSDYKNYCSNVCRHLGKRNRITKHCTVCNKEMIIPASNANRYSTCSKECQRKHRSDEGNCNWQGGNNQRNYRRKELSRLEYKKWRLAVFERDNYTCQFCKIRGGNIHADHIKPWKYFPELRYNIDNGRTLCIICHRTTFKDNNKWKMLKNQE
jgi:5-methylcytosine-specific restriction endonuclease McrA